MPTPRYWKPTVRQIRDTEDVSAIVANRPIQDQTQREEYLYGLIQSMNQSSGRLVRAGQRVSVDTEENDIVYYSVDQARFAPAIAEVSYINEAAVVSERSLAVGMALNVSAGFANILLFGRIMINGEPGEYSIDPLSLLDTQEGAFTPGVYYLSRKRAGKISRVPSAPVVQLGFFDRDGLTLVPVFKDLQEAHFHYGFDLDSRPAASQNFLKNGWHIFTGDPTEHKFVDYFNRGGLLPTEPPPIIATIRWSGAPDPEAMRVDISRFSDTEVSINLISGGGLDYNNPQSIGFNSTIITGPWPEYGEYMAIGSTGLEVAFLRSDATYLNTLTDDAANLLFLGTDMFKIFLPDDLRGWTNVNHLQFLSPDEARYRFVIDGHASLSRAFPPLPLESAAMETNGVSLRPVVDFVVDLNGIWWIPTGMAAPWPTDFAASGVGMDSANGRHTRLIFTKQTTANANRGVQSLQSSSPSLVITNCPEGAPASQGQLKIDLNLGLMVSPDIVEGQDLAIVGVSGETLLAGPIVTELIPGPGILLERLSASLIPGARNTGKVRISRRDVNLSGEVTSIDLRNAKETIKNNFSYPSFPPPARTTSSIVGKVTIPITDLGPMGFRLFIQPFGSIATQGDQQAIFKLTYQALRPGFNVGEVSEIRALAVQHWRIPFPSGYAALAIRPEFPVNVDDYPITPVTITNTQSPVFTGGLGLVDGDHVFVTIQRVAADPVNLTDNYPGDVGLAGIRWTITAE